MDRKPRLGYAVTASLLLAVAAPAMAGPPVLPAVPRCSPGVVRASGAALVWALDSDDETVGRYTVEDLSAEIEPFPFGEAATDEPIVGDWDDSGSDNVGVVRPVAGLKVWKLDTDFGGRAEIKRFFGRSGDTPVPGRFADPDAPPVLGVTRPGRGVLAGALLWKLDTANDGGRAETSAVFGRASDLPLVGDWDGDGIDNLGVVRTVKNQKKFFLDTDGGGRAEIIFVFDWPSDFSRPLACDWDADGVDDVSVVVRSETRFGQPRPALLWVLDSGRRGLGGIDLTSFGRRNGDTPVAGAWDASR